MAEKSGPPPIVYIVLAVALVGGFFFMRKPILPQSTVRTVAIDGLTPDGQNYLYKRILYYVYKNPPSAPVQAFLSYASSSAQK